MSDENSPGGSHSEAAAPVKKSNNLLYILLTILVLGLIGLFYDRQVARPAVEQASEDLADAVAVSNRKLEDNMTPDKVEEVLGRAAVQSFEDGDDYVEVFAWRSGLPIRTHKLYAVYRMMDGQRVLYRHALFKYETKGEVIPIASAVAVQAEEEDAEASSEDEPAVVDPLVAKRPAAAAATATAARQAAPRVPSLPKCDSP